ncbi:lipid-A-disaccharide synthase-related protein [Candidatus Synechococcus spongiarum]|uniref:lipid-A-disaccharide synthase-related protein n=1 Tax=Candidatus Synechococcus spongiarum TaxID=431041 RepID=UPI0004725FFB|nr:lipid-A-disaccharide synthase-related protein [Candidatus Synechococcus spongiarum]
MIRSHAPRLLLVSNGHGEDLSGAHLGRALAGLGAYAAALPLVGHGKAYKQLGIPTVAATRSFPTHGMGYQSLWGRLQELVNGQTIDGLKQSMAAVGLARSYSAVVAVGDVVPVVVARLSRRPSFCYLVAYSSHYEGRLRLPWPCGPILQSEWFRAVFSRDRHTAADLSTQLNRKVQFLGNPFMDAVGVSPLPLPSLPHPRVGLLPGSRLPEALDNLALMLAMLAHLPRQLGRDSLGLAAALVKDVTVDHLGAMAAKQGWRLQQRSPRCPGAAAMELVHGSMGVELYWGRFADVLHGSQLLVAMAGTATEQAVGLAKPILQMPGAGPQFTPGFAEAQRRLLGPAVFCGAGLPGSVVNAQDTARLLMVLLRDGDMPTICLRTAHERIGAPGGSKAMAQAILGGLN